MGVSEMTVREFLQKFSINDVARTLTDEYFNKNEKRATFESVIKKLNKTLKSINRLKINVNSSTILHADKTVDELEGYDYCDVCCSEVGDDTKYSVLMVDWKDFLGYQIDDNIDQNDVEAAAAIIWELTWHGWTYRTHKKYRKKMEKDLSRTAKELKRSSGLF